MKTICVVGTGYVGLVTGTCFADLGNRVICLDIDEEKVTRLRAGRSPSTSRGWRSWCSATSPPGACASPPATPMR